VEKDSISKIARKVMWSTRAIGRSARIESIYDNNDPVRPEFIRRIVGPVFLEPQDGYAITGDGLLVEESVRPHFFSPVPAWRNGGLPSPRWFERTRRNPDAVDYYPTVVSLRHFWEWNYYHFHLDVLGKLSVLRDHGVGRDLPHALGRYVRQLGFASEILSQGALSNRNWIIPDVENTRIIAADELIYCCVDGTSYKRRLSCFLDELNLPPVDANKSARVFLNRQPPANRRILNFSEVKSIFEEREFAIVDAAQLSVVEQMRLFSGTRYLAAIHGAGVTNIIYRRGAPLSLLELHAESYVTEDMKGICSEFGYHYGRLGGEPARDQRAQGASFYVDKDKLREALDKLLSH
jgi:hypothetical protein